jgi:hypothetical protein
MRDYARARHHRSPSRSEVRRATLHPPLPAVCINNNLLLWSSVSDPSRDRVDSFSSTLRHRRKIGELNGWAGAAFLRMASLRCEAKDPNKDERPCQLFRCNTGHASRIAMSRVVPCEHVRPQTVSADDTVVGYSEQTPMEAPLGKPEGVFHDSIPGENGVGLRFRAEFFNIFNHPNFGNPNNTLNTRSGVGSSEAANSSCGISRNSSKFMKRPLLSRPKRGPQSRIREVVYGKQRACVRGPLSGRGKARASPNPRCL